MKVYRYPAGAQSDDNNLLEMTSINCKQIQGVCTQGYIAGRIGPQYIY